MSTIEEIFRKNLVRLRGKRTQADIAEMAEIPLRSYQRCEYGDIPQAGNRAAIARALGVKESALFVDLEEYAPRGKLSPTEALEIIGEALKEKPPTKKAPELVENDLLKRLARAIEANPAATIILESALTGLEMASSTMNDDKAGLKRG